MSHSPMFRAPGRPCPAPGVMKLFPERADPRDRRAPRIDMARIHAEKRKLCDALEAIADTLPSQVDRLECLKAAGEIVPLLRECHRFEEETLFPAFLAAGGRGEIVARLKAEHVEDQGTAQELAEELFRIGHGEAVHNPEALGYLLRAFFESVRRHMAFERDHVLPATREEGGALRR